MSALPFCHPLDPVAVLPLMRLPSVPARPTGDVGAVEWCAMTAQPFRLPGQPPPALPTVWIPAPSVYRPRPTTRRERLEAAIAAAIDLLDRLDGDPDLELEPEEDSDGRQLDLADLEDDSNAPGPTLCRSTAHELWRGTL